MPPPLPEIIRVDVKKGNTKVSKNHYDKYQIYKKKKRLVFDVALHFVPSLGHVIIKFFKVSFIFRLNVLLAQEKFNL